MKAINVHTPRSPKQFLDSSQYDNSSPYNRRNEVSPKYSDDDRFKPYKSPFNYGKRNIEYVNPSLLSNDIFYQTPQTTPEINPRRSVSPTPTNSARNDGQPSPRLVVYNNEKSSKATRNWKENEAEKSNRSFVFPSKSPRANDKNLRVDDNKVKAYDYVFEHNMPAENIRKENKFSGPEVITISKEYAPKSKNMELRPFENDRQKGDAKTRTTQHVEVYDYRREIPNYWNIFNEKKMEVTSSYRADFKNHFTPRRSLTPSRTGSASGNNSKDQLYCDFDADAQPQARGNQSNDEKTLIRPNKSPSQQKISLPFKNAEYNSPAEPEPKEYEKPKIFDASIKEENPLSKRTKNENHKDYSIMTPRSQTPKDPMRKLHGNMMPDSCARMENYAVLKPSNTVIGGEMQGRELENMNGVNENQTPYYKHGYDENLPPEPNQKKKESYPHKERGINIQSHAIKPEETFLEFELKRNRNKEAAVEDPKVKRPIFALAETQANGQPKEVPKVMRNGFEGLNEHNAYNIICNSCMNEHLIIEKQEKTQKERELLYREQKEFERSHLEHLEDLAKTQLSGKNMHKIHYEDLKQQMVEQKLNDGYLRKNKGIGPGVGSGSYLFGDKEALIGKYSEQLNQDLRDSLARQVSMKNEIKSSAEIARSQIERTGLEVDSDFRNPWVPSRQKYLEELDEQVQNIYRQRNQQKKDQQMTIESENYHRQREAEAIAEKALRDRKAKEESRDMILTHIENRTKEKKQKKELEQQQGKQIANKAVQELLREEEIIKKQAQEKKIYLNEWLDSQVEYKKFTEKDKFPLDNQAFQAPSVFNGISNNNHRLDKGICECDRCRRPILSLSEKNTVSMMRKF